MMNRHERKLYRLVERSLRKSLAACGVSRWLRSVGGVGIGGDGTLLERTLQGPIIDIVRRPAKRWRPLWGLAMAEALGADARRIADVLVPIAELCHSGSLIIDDIEDNAVLRRTAECIHLRYGVDIAVNAANFLYFFPFAGLHRIGGISPDQRLAIFDVMTRTFTRAHVGQAQDLAFAHLSERQRRCWLRRPRERTVLQMYADKTGSAVEAVALVAGILSGVSGGRLRACGRFSRTVGIAFQIMNDIASVEAADSVLRYADIRGKKTIYVMMRALSLSPPRIRARLVRLLSAATATNAQMQELNALIRSSGAVEDCRRRSLRMTADAWRTVRPHLRDHPSTDLLERLWRALLR